MSKLKVTKTTMNGIKIKLVEWNGGKNDKR